MTDYDKRRAAYNRMIVSLELYVDVEYETMLRNLRPGQAVPLRYLGTLARR
ncbi:MAG: hypothetical protein ACRKGH_02015 [Dehalogenimonas sp.]